VGHLLRPSHDNLHLREFQLSDDVLQPLGFFLDGFEQCEPEIWQEDPQRQPWETCTGSHIEATQGARLTLYGHAVGDLVHIRARGEGQEARQ